MPQKADAAALRAGLVFFRNGQRLSDTPMVAPAEYDEKTRTASFRISLPLAGLNAGRYTVQAIVVDAGTSYAAFARNYFALRPAPKPAPLVPPSRPRRAISCCSAKLSPFPKWSLAEPVFHRGTSCPMSLSV